MNAFTYRAIRSPLTLAALGLALVCTRAVTATGAEVLSLTGSQEVPPVETSATAGGSIRVSPDKSVSGGITTKGIAATAAHIHEGEQGRNGPVVIPLTKSPDDQWVVPPGAKLSDSQFESYKAGKLYVNVHSAAHKDGEIRDQIKP